MLLLYFFFFNDTATTEIYTLSLHDAFRSRATTCPASLQASSAHRVDCSTRVALRIAASGLDRKSTRLNSSHPSISYAVFCLKKKKTILLASSVRLKPVACSRLLCVYELDT